VLLRGVMHDHTGEHHMAHEWDVMSVSIIATVACVFLFAGLGIWRAWSSLRTWLWILASPLAGIALMIALLWFRHLVNPIPG
jgi:hypothetical protein